jgi:hypothetical protein
MYPLILCLGIYNVGLVHLTHHETCVMLFADP